MEVQTTKPQTTEALVEVPSPIPSKYYYMRVQLSIRKKVRIRENGTKGPNIDLNSIRMVSLAVRGAKFSLRQKWGTGGEIVIAGGEGLSVPQASVWEQMPLPPNEEKDPLLNALVPKHGSGKVGSDVPSKLVSMGWVPDGPALVDVGSRPDIGKESFVSQQGSITMMTRASQEIIVDKSVRSGTVVVVEIIGYMLCWWHPDVAEFAYCGSPGHKVPELYSIRRTFGWAPLWCPDYESAVRAEKEKAEKGKEKAV